MAGRRLFLGTVRRFPFLVLGAVGGWALFGWHRGDDWTLRSAIPATLCGALVGLWLYPDFRGLCKALRSRSAVWALFWPIVGMLASGSLGLAVKWLGGDAAAGDYAWLLGGDALTTWSRWALLGGLLLLSQVGNYFDSHLKDSGDSGAGA